MNRLKELYNAGSVTRFHTKRVHHVQTIAEHSWGVAMILMDIVLDPSMQLIQAALHHDLAESVTGDTPATAKWASYELKTSLQKLEDNFNSRLQINHTLMPEEQEALRWADMIELIMYCQAEVDMGNTKMESVVRTGIAYLDARIPPTLEASRLLEQLR